MAHWVHPQLSERGRKLKSLSIAYLSPALSEAGLGAWGESLAIEKIGPVIRAIHDGLSDRLDLLLLPAKARHLLMHEDGDPPVEEVVTNMDLVRGAVDYIEWYWEPVQTHLMRRMRVVERRAHQLTAALLASAGRNAVERFHEDCQDERETGRQVGDGRMKEFNIALRGAALGVLVDQPALARVLTRHPTRVIELADSGATGLRLPPLAR